MQTTKPQTTKIKELAMRKKNNTTQIKKANNTSREEDFSQLHDLSLEDAKKYLGHKRIISAHVVDDRSLTDSQKMLYGLLDALSHNEKNPGYCFARNEVLCQIMGCKLRTLQRNLEKLVKKGLLIVEISQQFYQKSIRRIWTLDQFAIRNRLEKIYGKPKLNQINFSHVTDDMTSCHGCHTYIERDISSTIEVVMATNEKSSPPPKKTPPSSAITTAFPPGKKERKNKPQLLLTDQQITGLEDRFGKPMIDNLRKKSGDLAKENPKAFTNKSEHDYVYDWALIESKKKANRFTKKEEANNVGKNDGGKMEDVSYEIDEKRRKDFADYIKTIKEKPANRMICDLIIPNGGCTRAELRHTPGNLSVDSIKYDDPTYRDKMKKWMQEIAEELRSTK